MKFRWISLAALAVGACIFGLKSQATSSAEPETDGPDLAMEWRRLAWVDEKGRIAPDAYASAIDQMKRLRSLPTYGTNALSVEKWVERGPTNVAGRSRCLLIDPTNSQRMWMGSVGGGIWKSTDGGANWDTVSDSLPSLAISTLVMDPGNPLTMYAGTGEGYFNSDAISGRGILKSGDGGATWTLLSGSSALSNVNRIAISPTDSNNLLAGVRYGGFYRSTNGGTTWTKVLNAQMGSMIAFHPTDGTKAVGSVLDYDFGRSTWYCKALYSTDGGATWNDATGITHDGFSSRIELAYAKSNPLIVYGNSAYDGKVYKSTDGGKNFAAVTTSGSTAASWYNNSIWVDPTDANRVVTTGFRVCKSVNGGVTVTNISDGYILTETPHPDCHFGVADPGYDGVNNRRFYVTTDGGAYVTNNIWGATTTTGWSRLSNNARTSQFYGAVGDEQSGRIIGGMQDNGSFVLNPPSTVGSMFFGGDGGWCAMDPTDSNKLYGEYVYLQLFRSLDGGASANWIDGGLGDANTAANFIAPFVKDDSNPDRLYAGGASLWRTTNLTAATPTWKAIKSSAGSYISAIAVSPSNPDVVWVGHNDGQIYRSANATSNTPTWTTVDNNSGTNPLPSRYVGRILIDRADPAKAYVGLGGFTSDNLWYSSDSGATWVTRVGTGATGLPSAPIRGLAQHPADPARIFVGTEVGLLESKDGGATWAAPLGAPGFVSIDELNFMYHSNKLLAATHGRGLWTFGVTGIKTLTGPSSLNSGQSGTCTITLDTPGASDGEVITLKTSNAALTVPASVTVDPGKWSATFPISASTVQADKDVTITATLGGSVRSRTVHINPPKVVGLVIAPVSVAGATNGRATGTVTINPIAGSPNQPVSITLSSPIMTTPAILRITTGLNKGTFVVTTSPVNVTTTQSVTATIGTTSKTVNLEVRTSRPTRIVLSTASVKGSSATVVTGKVLLDVPAAAGGALVSLSSSDSAAGVPATVTVPAGATSVSFTVSHSAVAAKKTVTLTATRDGVSATKVLTVNP